MWIRELSVLECTKMLTASHLARLACVKQGQPYVVPMHLAYANRHLYGFSMPGRKIEWMRHNPRVSVQFDEPAQGRGWKSIIARGHYEELDDSPQNRQEREHAWRLISSRKNWWEPGSLNPVHPTVSNHYEHVFFRIVIDEITGREAVDQEQP